MSVSARNDARRRGGWLRLLVQDEGIAITEYGLLVALIALAVVAVLTVFGAQISSWFATKTGQVTTV
jgi:Flp pilus assembly pilin Flp